MTLVCNPSLSMPSDPYSSGVDVLYPSSIMNPHHFPDSDWDSHPPLLPSPYEPKSQLPPFTRASQESLSLSIPQYAPPTYSTSHRPPPIQVTAIPSHQMSRPKSSPSTFGPNVEDLLFTENPFKLKTDEFPPPIFTLSPQSGPGPHDKITSPYYPASEYSVSNPSQSPIRRPIPIAPDPIGLSNMNALKRAREDEEASEYGHKKRKRAASQSGPVELNDEEQLLLRLKEDENLPWKDIAVRFQTDLGKAYQVPALQMRFKRLRERMRTWTESDVSNVPSYSQLPPGLRNFHRYRHSNKHTTIGKSFNLI